MCFAGQSAACSEYGLPAGVRFCPIFEIGRLLGSALPYGKAAIIFDEECDLSVLSRIRAQLGNYTPVSVALGKTDGFTGLFSLPDDIRAAVGVGERSALAARFFATLRGGYSVVVPLLPSAREIFETAVPARFPWAGYPLKAADFVVADGELMRSRACEALAETSLCALCAEELETDAVFSGTRKEFRFRLAADTLAESELSSAEGANKLFCASAVYHIELDGAPALPCVEAARVLNKKTLRPLPECAFAVFRYFADRNVYLFAQARPRPFYVPDYAARVNAAAAWAEEPSEKFFRFLHVPAAQESFRLAQLFGECRKKLLTSALMLAETAAKLCGKYYGQGGAMPSIAQEELKAAYEHSAELSPLLSASALEREFGLLPSPGRGGLCPLSDTNGKTA